MEGAKILSISFNQGGTSFVAGTDQGFAMYRVNPLEKLSERVLGGGIGIAVQLYETNFFGLVGGGDNPMYPVNQFVLWNDYTAPSGSAIVTKVEKDKIVAVKLNHDVVAVVTRKCSMLYSLKDMQLVRKVKTSSNPDGVCDLSSVVGTVFLCPGMDVGTVNIVDYKAGTERIVNCCSHSLRHIAINTVPDVSEESIRLMPDRAPTQTQPDSMFAVGSVEGTLVRVYDIATQTMVKELRRGADACELYSLCLSPDSKCLSVTSSKNTVHVFGLDKEFENQSSRASFLGGYFGSEWSSFAVEFAPIALVAPQPGGPQFQPRSGPVRHIASVFPASNTGNDSYRMIVLAYDGSYAIHDLQFKDHKAIPRMSGMFSTLPLAGVASASSKSSSK